MYITIAQWAPLVLAVAAGCIAIRLAGQKSSLAAATAGGFCIILFLISNLSQLEKFSGLGVEATIRNHLDDSKKIYAQIKSVTEEFLDLSYQNVKSRLEAHDYPIDIGLDWLRKLDKLKEDHEINSSIVDKSQSDLKKQIYTRMGNECRRFIVEAIYGNALSVGNFFLSGPPPMDKTELVSRLSDEYRPLKSYDKAYEDRYLNIFINKCADEAELSMQSHKMTPRLKLYFSADSQEAARSAAGLVN